MSDRPHILYLVHRIPYPPNRGDRIRSFHLLEFLAARANVHLATLADEPLEANTRHALESRCQQVAIEPLTRTRWWNAGWSMLQGNSATEGLFASKALRRTLEQWTRDIQFDAVVVFCSSMVPYLDLPALRNVPTIVDLVDVDSQKFFDYAAASSGIKRWLYQLEARRLRRFESSLPARVRAITLVTEAEADIYRGFCPNEKTFAVGNGVDLDYFQPTVAPVRAKRCVFVGALNYRPNIDGSVWFCREVWPTVRAEHPTATLAIVGRNPDAAVRNLASIPGVEVIGAVPDVRPHVAEAQVVVVPLRIARGLQNKVLEALAMGKPVIASPQAIEGLQVEVGMHLIAAEQPAEWQRMISRLFADDGERERLSSAGRAFTQEHHDWSRCLERMSGWLPGKIASAKLSRENPNSAVTAVVAQR